MVSILYRRGIFSQSRVDPCVECPDVVKAFKASGYELAHSRDKERRGYYLRGEGELSEELYIQIKGAVDEIDPKQVEITRRLCPAQRVQQGLSLTGLAHSVVNYRRKTNQKGS